MSQIDTAPGDAAAAEPGPDSPPDDRRASRNILTFASAQFISSTGGWIQKTAIGWLTWDLTHSTAWVGAMALTDLIAGIWVAPFAGAVADRKPAFTVLRTTQSLMLLQALILCALSASGQLTIWALFALALTDSTLQGFNQPVRMTANALLAGPERLAQAIASSSVAFNLARTIGPAVAGLVLVKGGASLAFALNAASFLAMLGAVLHLRRDLARPAIGSHAPGTLRRDILDGFAYVARTPRIGVLFLTAGIFGLLARPFSELFPAFAGQVLKGGPETLATLLSAQGAGAFAGALWMVSRRGAGHLAPTALVAAIGLTTALVCFAATTDIKLAAVCMVAAGLCHVVCTIGLQSLTQLGADIGYRGRVMSLYGLLFRTTPGLGAFMMGVAAHWVPLQGLVAGAAVAAAFLMLGFGLAFRRLYAPEP